MSWNTSRALGILGIFIIAALMIAANVDFTDVQGAPRAIRYVNSGEIRVWIDPETGCEYFAGSGQRRFRADGVTPMCDLEGATR